MFDSWWRRHPRVVFFALGVAASLVSVGSQVFWYDVVSGVFHRGIAYDARPLWLRAVVRLLAWSPLVGFVAIVVGRVRYGRVFRPIAFAVGGVSVYVLGVVSLLAGPSVEGARHEARFASLAWRQKAKGPAMWAVRLTMVDDLLRRGLLEHASRDSVDRLLGPGDSTSYFRDWDLVYWLGPERGLFRIDSEWLVVTFGLDGRASAARIVRD